MLRLRFRYQPPFLIRTIALTILALLPLASSYAQEDEVVRVDTDLVVLNVTVLDKEGQYVPGLKLADFKVFEDGREVPLTLIKSFGPQESPFASVILLDTSGSMESRMTLGRSAAIRFLDGLRAEDVAAVFNFDYRIEQVQDFSSARDLAPMAFGLRAKGMTALYDAIIRAAESLAARPENRKAIIVLSDGMDTQSRASSGKALEAALAIGAGIYAVDMSASEGRAASKDIQSAQVLKDFSEKSGGRFIATPGGPALRDAFASIAQELGHQYTIAFRPANQTRDGRWRTLEVKLSRPELTVRTRKGYRAPKR
jgi:Ca-activated chloride channel family protein